MINAIEVNAVRKSYGSTEIIKGMTFNVPMGCCFGVLGPNGAGKTTLMGMMEGITPFNEGTIKILDMDISTQLKHIQPRVGIQLQKNNYFKFLSVGQLLKFYVELRQASSKNQKTDPHAVSEILAMLSLSDKIDMKVSELSGGQAQRFSIAVAMLEDPEIIFLDEPTSALDPQNRRYTWDFIEKIKKDKNKTIMLTTHSMEEAEILCDELLIMDDGQIISHGAPSQLVRSLNKHQGISFKYSYGEFTDEFIRSVTGVVGFERDRNALSLQSNNSIETIRSFLEHAKQNQIEIVEFDVKLPNLEDVFITKTGAALRDE